MAWDQKDEFKHILEGDIEKLDRDAERARQAYLRRPVPRFSDAQRLPTSSLSAEGPTAQPYDSSDERPTEPAEGGRLLNEHARRPTENAGLSQSNIADATNAERSTKTGREDAAVLGPLPTNGRLAESSFVDLQSNIFGVAAPQDVLEECFTEALAASVYGLALVRTQLAESAAPVDKRLSGSERILESVRSVALKWLSREDELRVEALEMRLAEIEAKLAPAGSLKPKTAGGRRKAAKKTKKPHAPL